MTSDETRSLIAALRSDATKRLFLGVGTADRIEQAADALEAGLEDAARVERLQSYMLAQDLKLPLSTGQHLYGFACPEHGLCYYQVNTPGQPMNSRPIRSVPGGYPDLHDGDALCCQECASELGFCCGDPSRAPRIDRVPAFSARQLGALLPLVEKLERVRAELDAIRSEPNFMDNPRWAHSRIELIVEARIRAALDGQPNPLQLAWQQEREAQEVGDTRPTSCTDAHKEACAASKMSACASCYVTEAGLLSNFLVPEDLVVHTRLRIDSGSMKQNHRCGFEIGCPPNSLQDAATSTERRLTSGNAGYRDAAPGVAGDPDSARPTDVTPGEPTDAERLDALERMVQESAGRGEAVELDGRGGCFRVERWGAGHVFEVSADGPTLRSAIDASIGQEAGND